MISKYIVRMTLIATTIICLQGTAIANKYEFTKKIDHLLLEKFQPNDTGAVFLVAKDGVPIYRKAFGKANIELDVDMKATNVFQIGSMTKQFTALSILILHEQKKLDVNDNVAKYLPNYPNGENITLHHLLTHTSGIKDFTKMKTLWAVAKKDHSPQELVDFFKNESVDFNPGEKFKYNNSGYALLGYIIEIVSKETYENFVEKQIFKTLKMKDSRYANDREVIKNRAYGYHNKGQYTNRIMVSLSIPYSSGSLMSTADDLLIWQQAIDKHLLVKQSTIEMAFSKYRLKNGEPISYGYGWHLKDLNGVPTREHGGSVFGFKSMGVYIPSLNVYVVGLTNCDCNSPTQITKDIASLFIE
ncbi:serine hydrolase [Thalassotalea sp. PP2-459]|uniref:serine hydrolase domain-containing protein n=1 Tax=Thalassotalea sp. PP2-459 TaxID=1742724 RepID=UPI00094573C6|nr:serine hydrolase domain-containing protein [Thalassotalea sp. PP2-459]OKY25029.1 serine hydrolase [Thalassotalea sp. PP2-459]